MPFATIDPANGNLIKKFETQSDSHVDKAIGQSHSGFEKWRNVGLQPRIDLLTSVSNQLRLHSRELAELTTLEMGKPISQAVAEVDLAARIFEYYANIGPALISEEQISTPDGGIALVRSAPIGPLLGIMPWNFPYYQVARFVAPNLLLGNTILLKHAPNCPQQAAYLEQLIADAGAPAGVYQNLFIEPEQTVSIIEDARVQGVSLTGSERAGRSVAEVAGRSLKKTVLELGGSDPFLVLPDADIELAVGMAVSGRFWNAGQTCTSSKRFIVHESIWDSFVDQFVAETNTWTVGHPAEEGTDIGPMATIDGRDSLAAQVDDAIRAGAVVHVGGQTPTGPGAYYPATVLSKVTSDMRAYREELFGPVAVLYKVQSIDEAVALANDTAFGLGSAVFTQDLDVADSVADRLDVGMVGINTIVRSSPELPFGGVKASGFGRELGKLGLEEFSNKKLIKSLAHKAVTSR